MSLPKKKRKNHKFNFSKNLRDMRSIALTITKNNKLRLKYDAKQETSFCNIENNEITLSLSSYPDFVLKNWRIGQKVLDGDLGHECGHVMLSKPLWTYFNNWITKIKRNRGSFKLAHLIVNLIEDKRVNHFIELRYRFDFGKRLKLANLIIKDTVETTFSNPRFQIPIKYGDAPLIVSILSNEGLYEAKMPKVWSKLSKEAKAATKTCLEIMENMRYKRLRIDLIRGCQQIYDQIIPFLPKGQDFAIKLMLSQRSGGEIKGNMSQQLKNKLKGLIKAEIEKEIKEEAKKVLEDLLKGSGAGEGTGREIPTPEPDFNEYQRLLDKNKPEITRLLNKLKILLKPIVRRRRFQKRGKLMPSLMSKAYTNSLRNIVKNVYLNVKTRFEREQVAIGFLFDFSGSVDRTEANDITIILNEVFGHYVDDYGFAVACFGADSQKIKTFFETFENTKARCGNVGVSAWGTEISVLLTAFLKMFNAITSDRRKILVVASDFEFGDNDKALDLIRLYPLANIEIIFIGFCNCRKVRTWASDLKNTRRTAIKSVSDLPEAFLDVYLNIQK